MWYYKNNNGYRRELPDRTWVYRYNGTTLDMTKFLQVKRTNNKVKNGIAVSGSNILDDMAMNRKIYSSFGSNGTDPLKSAYNECAAWVRYIDFDSSNQPVYGNYIDYVVNEHLSNPPKFGDRGISPDNLLYVSPSANRNAVTSTGSNEAEFNLNSIFYLNSDDQWSNNPRRLKNLTFIMKHRFPMDKQYFMVFWNRFYMTNYAYPMLDVYFYVENNNYVIRVSKTNNNNNGPSSIWSSTVSVVKSNIDISDGNFHTVSMNIDENLVIELYVDNIRAGITNVTAENSMEIQYSNNFTYCLDIISWETPNTYDNPTTHITQTGMDGNNMVPTIIKAICRFDRKLTPLEIRQLSSFYSN